MSCDSNWVSNLQPSDWQYQLFSGFPDLARCQSGRDYTVGTELRQSKVQTDINNQPPYKNRTRSSTRSLHRRQGGKLRTLPVWWHWASGRTAREGNTKT
ncbi:hypothetical protein SKAU_G00429170 [Synaphobranchus kaupii]|uniref:Uncharacterized protein n=1 Tax=Synaphobranchus kaupii TaxID=118154 RepID=A0A9Q1E4I2_SYNKA|nr:hypothetical protein SKAU_G00429170 [Synaphobranchus kaupii]